MTFITTALPGVIIVEPTVFRDDRGFFVETFHAERYSDGGIAGPFVQDNHSRSQRGTLRGLHSQSRKPQGKLVRCVEGEIFDVAVDMRRGSPTFGQWVGELLTADNFRQLYIPPDFLHGFYVTSEVAQVEYKCTDVYDPGHEISVVWNDPEIAIDWPLVSGEAPLLSKKDAAASRLADLGDALPAYPKD